MALSQNLYTDEQSNEIVRTAVRLAARDEISFDELVAAGKELGISREEMLEAETKYRHQISEAGLRAEFAQLQRKEVHAFGFHIAVYGTIAFLIAWLDMHLPVWQTLGVLSLAWLLIVALKQYYLARDTEKNEEKFQELQRKKVRWLRPERSKVLTEECMNRELSLFEKLSQWDAQEIAVNRLRRKFSYDKKRANAVAAAYFQEHPETEEKLRAHE